MKIFMIACLLLLAVNNTHAETNTEDDFVFEIGTVYPVVKGTYCGSKDAAIEFVRTRQHLNCYEAKGTNDTMIVTMENYYHRCDLYILAYSNVQVGVGILKKLWWPIPPVAQKGCSNMVLM